MNKSRGVTRGQGYMMSSSQGLAMVAIAALAFLAPLVSAQDNKNCTFGPGICPVTKENVVDVFYFDVVDDFSCQQHCLDLDECHFFTMYGVKDTPKDHMKCFMFKTCDHLEPCPECTTGPDHPPIPPPPPLCSENALTKNTMSCLYDYILNSFPYPSRDQGLKSCIMKPSNKLKYKHKF